jgi:hypothetical protein
MMDMETTKISTIDAYLALFKALPLAEQHAIFEAISELLEDIEDRLLIEERKDEPKDDYLEFRKTLFPQVQSDV